VPDAEESDDVAAVGVKAQFLFRVRTPVAGIPLRQSGILDIEDQGPSLILRDGGAHAPAPGEKSVAGRVLVVAVEGESPEEDDTGTILEETADLVGIERTEWMLPPIAPLPDLRGRPGGGM